MASGIPFGLGTFIVFVSTLSPLVQTRGFLLSYPQSCPPYRTLLSHTGPVLLRLVSFLPFVSSM